MAYHPLLDWRPARHFYQLGLDGTVDLRRWEPIRDSWRASTAQAANLEEPPICLQGGVWAIDRGGLLVAIAHPLENTSSAANSERLQRARLDAEGRGTEIVFTDSFNLMRRPGWALDRAENA